MEPNELAELLNGREYLREMTKMEEQLARDFGLVVVFGASDDLMEVRGCIDDEIGCYNGGIFNFEKTGFRWKGDEANGHWVGQNKIEAIWCGDKTDKDEVISWSYKIDIPHAEFMIYEDDDPYCKGIVFKVDELK